MEPVQAKPVRPEEAAGRTIVSIEWKGLLRLTQQTLEQKMETRPGRLFQPTALERDVKRLVEEGYVSQMEWKIALVPDGVTVQMTVRENEEIRKVRFEGLKAFGKDEIEGLQLKAGKFVSDYLLHLDRDTIRDKYLEKGYAFVKVDASFTPERDVVHRIEEGPQVFVRDVRVEGCQTISPSDCTAVMRTSDSIILSIPLAGELWLSHESYVEEQLKYDLDRIKNFVLRAEGFLDGEVKIRALEYHENQTQVVIVLQVIEGPKYQVRRLGFEGNALLPSDELRQSLRLKEGEPYALKYLRSDVKAIEEAYGEKSYLATTVEPRATFLETPGDVDLLYRIEEGVKTKVGLIRIEGNSKTRDDVIRRSLMLEPGESFNTKKLRRSIDRLNGLGYFAPVEHRFEDSALPESKDLVLDVKEQGTGQFILGGGISSNVGFIGRLGLEQRNFDLTRVPESGVDVLEGNAFAGGGQFFRLLLQPGARNSRYSLQFEEPWMYGTPISFGLQLFASDSGRFFFQEERRGGSIDLGRRWENGFRIGMAFSTEGIKISDISSTAPQDVFDVEGRSRLSSIGPRVSYDRRNSVVFPTAGYKLGLSTEFAGHAVGGDYDFVKVVLEGDTFTTLYTTETKAKHVLHLGLQAAGAEANGRPERLPVFERFYAGGGGSVRGFEFRTISPKDRGEPIGGHGLLAGTAEYLFPLYRPEFRGESLQVLTGVVFADAGNVTMDLNRLHATTFRSSAGFGIRIAVPGLGPAPIAFDFGFPLHKEPGDDRQVVSFNLGYFFF